VTETNVFQLSQPGTVLVDPTQIEHGVILSDEMVGCTTLSRSNA
jgi:hypothetical protein